MYIYRRVVLLAGARADIQPLARDWGVVIQGRIGRNPLRVLECYRGLYEARLRRKEINVRGAALVESVEEILFPSSTMVAKFDTSMHRHIPPLPPDRPKIEPYSKVEDVYDLPRLRKSS